MTSCAIAVILLLGAGTVLYPSTADWFSDRAHATEVSGYVDDVKNAPAADLQQMIQDAHEYNEELPDGPLRDPFSLTSDGSAESVEQGRADYESQLQLHSPTQDSPTTDIDAVPMARIRIPEIKVDLPIYHGTDAETLERGIGHLYGTSLPVGNSWQNGDEATDTASGKGTNAVLSGHSGLPQAALFTHVNELREGDLFYIDVAGETLTYEVDKISTVLPDDAEQLRQVDGKDYVTLLTCTPIGINSHRLLVRGVRVDTAADTSQTADIAPNAQDPGFPWWALGAAGALAVSIAVAWPRRPASPIRSQLAMAA